MVVVPVNMKPSSSSSGGGGGGGICHIKTCTL
jgi:hypothetical protein